MTGRFIEKQSGRGNVVFSVHFVLQYLHFNMRRRRREGMEKLEAVGEKAKTGSMVRMCNSFACSPFLLPVFLYPLLDRRRTEFINTG